MNFQWPPESNWPEMLCAKLGGERKTGQVNHLIAWMLVLILFSPSQRLNIIIVSEGAIDRDGNPITADAVKKVFVVVDKIESQLVPGCCGQIETRYKGDSVGACSGFSSPLS